jgi:hypothetical protein
LNCKRHGISCSFSALSLTTTTLSHESLADLQLLDYWHRRHSQVPSANPSSHDPVRLGFSHHYLLNSILAVAALQLFNEDRSQTRWYVRAAAHRQAAITRARPHFQHLEESQHLALLSFTMYTSMYALAEPLLRPTLPRGSSQPELDPVGELVQAIRLGRSSNVFVQQHLASVRSDAFLVAKYNPHPLGAVQGLESRFPQLAWLRGFIQRQCRGRASAVCLEAAESLFVGIAGLGESPDDPIKIMRTMWGWASNVDGAFLDMCSAHDPVALVIFAHFAVLMNLARGDWYMQKWPAALLGQIRTLLTKDGLEDTIRWPEEVVFKGKLVLLFAT